MIAPKLLRYPMNEEQKAIVSHKQGPLLVIAGPGSGKTRSLTLLAMNLLLCADATPSEIVLCTYTEKAAYDLQDRLTYIAKDVAYKGDLSQLRIGTIHGICNQLIAEYPDYTPLGNNYETLDQFTQQLLILEHLDEICVYHTKTFFQQRWESIWEVTKKLKFFFDKIAEELIFDQLKDAFPHVKHYSSEQDTFVCFLTHAYCQYQKILARTNCIDFAHLQKCAYNLLTKPHIHRKITKGIRYVLVDEYQDTNYIQEQILTLLASGTDPKNLCVIGDEDQALYRFRGATVRNILEFAQTFPDCKQIHLTTNYRSHPMIIDVCNQWMTDFDWSDTTGKTLRTEKTIRVVPNKQYSNDLAVRSIKDVDTRAEAQQFAELVYSLKRHDHISDYSQVALLLHSVRPRISSAYIEALASKGIPAYCPRARTFFDQEEICLMIGCFARILQYPSGRQASMIVESYFPTHIKECQTQLADQCRLHVALEKALQAIERKIISAEEEQEQEHKQQLADYFYRLIFIEPFSSFLTDESKRLNLVVFSKLLKTFQRYYHYTSITNSNLSYAVNDFFHTFLCLLYVDGLSQDEDQQQLFPKGHVQIMTIHQAKGLEFPVVAVGRLDKLPPPSDNEDKYLQRFYHHPSIEPEKRIPAFDVRRLYYVAFSRAEHLLVLTANKTPHPHFASLWQAIPSWSYPYKGQLRIWQPFQSKEYLPPKPRYGFTSHIQTYTTCPRQFQFFHEYRFVSSRSVEAFFGLLVHQTIESIHRRVLDGELDPLDEKQVRAMFETTYKFLVCTNMRPVDDLEKEQAFHQVLNYFHHSQQWMQSIQATELGVQVEKDDYILKGKIDLIMRGQSGLEILDFKTRARPKNNSPHLTFYKQQLYLYAYALQKRTGQFPQRLFLYWTAERCKEDALMEIPYQEEDMHQALCHVDDIVAKIQQRQFAVITPPAPEICKACDVRRLCRKERII